MTTVVHAAKRGKAASRQGKAASGEDSKVAGVVKEMVPLTCNALNMQ